MTIYDVTYQEHYSGCVQVEAGSPERAVEIFTDKLNKSIAFSDYMSTHVEATSSQISCDGVSIYTDHPEHTEIINDWPED